MRNGNQTTSINSNRRITRSATAALNNQILAHSTTRTTSVKKKQQQPKQRHRPARVNRPEGYAKNIEKDTILICMNCEVKLKDKLFALDCGHVSCGECQSQFKAHKKSCPGCGKKTKQALQLFA
nr:11674_t:CDS:1 [Entrophospora candida]CAG8581335.1 142_t:CDS:1 [Entrophospora candida]